MSGTTQPITNNDLLAAIQSLGQRLGVIEHRLDAMDKRFDGIDKRLDGMDDRFDGIDKRLDTLTQSIDDVAESLQDAIQMTAEGFDRVERRLVLVEADVRELKSTTARTDAQVGAMTELAKQVYAQQLKNDAIIMAVSGRVAKFEARDPRRAAR